VQKGISLVLVVALVWSLNAQSAFAQAAVGPPGLGQLEEILYGRVQEGALLSRLERIEMDVLGTIDSNSAFLVRVQKLLNMLTGAEAEVSLKMKLNATEWAMFQSINEGPSIARRLDVLETAMFGQPRPSQGIAARLEELAALMWPGGRVYTTGRLVPKGTLVKIELLTELNSERSKANDVVQYKVVEDVRIDGAIAIPAGTVGQGHVISATPSGNLGRDGLVQVDFGSVSAMDSTRVPIAVAERASEQNRSLELAAGAGLAGVILLSNPIGLAAGYFVRGRAHVVPVGTVFYVETANDVNVNALSLAPVVNR